MSMIALCHALETSSLVLSSVPSAFSHAHPTEHGSWNFLQQIVMVENSKLDDLMLKPLPRHFKCLVHCAFPLLDLTFLFCMQF